MAEAGQKKYLDDWQSMEMPEDPADIITVPRFPEEGRQFEIRRTYLTKRSSRARRRTPSGGYVEILKVVDSRGGLQFWRKGEWIHSIRLGECLSFANLDNSHDFAARGSPAFFTAPPDCKVWEGREWHQTYRTLVPGWPKPCVYEAKRRANVYRTENGRRFKASTEIDMTMEKDGTMHSWSNVVVYDENLGFFSEFDVGYVGRVEVLREIED